MLEIPHTQHKATHTPSWLKDSKCRGILKYKNRHSKTYYRRKLGGGWKYPLGTVVVEELVLAMKHALNGLLWSLVSNTLSEASVV